MTKNFLQIFVTPTDDGYGSMIYDPTMVGKITIAVLLVAVLLVALAFRSKGAEKRQGAAIRQLTFSAMAIALATVLSMIPTPKMPMGGHVTFFSLLVIALIGYWFGLAPGLACGFAYGLLQLFIDPYILSFPQMLCDYIFAFGALGLSGLFPMKRPNAKKKPFGSPKTTVVPGYIAAVIGRYFFAVLSGVIFFAAYAPETGILSNALLYALAYNGIYIGVEMVITIIVLLIPGVRKAIEHVGNMAAE